LPSNEVASAALNLCRDANTFLHVGFRDSDVWFNSFCSIQNCEKLKRKNYAEPQLQWYSLNDVKQKIAQIFSEFYMHL